MIMDTTFTFYLKDGMPITVVASADAVTPYTARRLRVKCYDANDERMYFNDTITDEIEEHAIELLCSEYGESDI